MIAVKETEFDSLDFFEKYHTEVPLGSFPGEKETAFSLWAPTAASVVLQLYRTGHEQEEPQCVPMKREEKGVWRLILPGNLSGTYYTYAVTVLGKSTVTVDPYARAAGLNGLRSMVIDLRSTDPEGWQADCAPERPTENIVYEVHVKDFSYDPAGGVEAGLRGKYLGLCAAGTTLNGDGIHATGMDYLKTLGITHVELMPIYDFGSVDEAGSDDQFNWGYDPVNYNVPEGSYSTNPYDGAVRIRELKKTIQTLHENGFRVIMDVVYNHTYSADSCLERTVPGYFYRKWANGRLSNGSGCGNDTASQRSMCARYILDSVLYWAEEYHVDGFRFDLMGLLPVELMNSIRRELDARFGEGEKLVFGEPWRAADTAVSTETALADKAHLRQLSTGVGAFCDPTRDALKGSLLRHDACGFVNGGFFSPEYLACCVGGWTDTEGDFCVKAPSQTISYLSSHDDWTLWDRLVDTLRGNGNYSARDEVVLKANRLAAAILYCCQGNLFLLSGEEFGRTKYGVKNSYCASLSINQLDWGRAWENEDLVSYYRGLIALRKQLPGLQDKSCTAPHRIRSVWQPEEMCAAILIENGGRWKELLLAVNVGQNSARISLPEGSWQPLFDGESSFLWQEEKTSPDAVTLPGKAAMLLGKR